MSDWQEVATLDDFNETDRKYIEIDEDTPAGLFKLPDGTFTAISVWCSHQRVSLMTGEVQGCEVMCPMHGARFDLRTGHHLSPPAYRGVPVYPVKVEDGRIYAKVE